MKGSGGKGDEWAADAAEYPADLLGAAEDRVSALAHAAKAAAQAYKERSTPILAQRRGEAKAELGEAKAELATRRDACRVPEDRQVLIHNKIKRLFADKNQALDEAKRAYEAMHAAEVALDAARCDHRKAETRIAELRRE